MNQIDTTLEPVENTRFKNIYHDLIKRMSKTTQFNEREVSCILMVYYKFVLINGPKAKSMTSKQLFYLFLIIFEIRDFNVPSRVLVLLSERDAKKEVDPVAWVRLFSIFMSDSLEQKMKFVYQVYNINPVVMLNREIVIRAVENFFTGDDEEEIAELRADMVEMLFQKFDLDKDGAISFEDYSEIVHQTPMLLEFLGTCLPSNTQRDVIELCGNIMSHLDTKQDDFK